MRKGTQSRANWYLWPVLVVSLLLNVYLLFHSGKSGTGDPGPDQAAGGFHQSPRSSFSPHKSTADCPVCSQQDVKHLRTPSCNSPPRLESSLAESEIAEAIDASRPLISRVTLDIQDAMLCEIALDTAREEWIQWKNDITRGLRDSLQDSNLQDGEVIQNVEEFAKILALDPDQRKELEYGYGPMRAARVAQVLKALDHEPPDYRVIYREVRDFFSDEDRLVDELFGTQARERLRAAKLQGRTTMLAILTAFADMEWEQAIGW